ncbi:hypothetical protein HK105_201474 [Polyrhizophydium stewartii]|uniref:Nucleoside diphosphate kinase n=1 Tax=Polyrhizophydium stewartii TaxID=2732419 RepID=A0ABR4NIA5_9FUNG
MLDTTRARYCFLVDWFDTHAQLTRQYEFFYYPSDATIEMYDSKQRRTFLKRTKSDLRIQDLFIGAAINVHARQLTIRDYGDEYSRSQLVKQMESTLLFIKPDGYASMGKILDTVIQSNFSICRVRMLAATPDFARNLLGPNAMDQSEIQSFVGGNSVAIELLMPNAVQSLADLAVNSGLAGKIISMIQDAGFAISDMELFHLDRSNGEDFLEVYKGVVPEYHITGDANVPIAFREFTGPSDPELAKQVRPKSLRAKFGVDKVRNSLHCTDLPEDGPLESQFFFRILPA